MSTPQAIQARASHAKPASPRKAIVVTLIGIALSLGVFYAHRFREHNARRTSFEQQAEELSQRIQRGFELPLAAVRTLPDFFAASVEITRAEFRSFVEPILKRHRNVTYVEWAPYVLDRDRAAFEARAQATEWPDFHVIEPNSAGKIVNAPQRAYYMPLLHAVALGDVRPLIGLDVSFDEERRARNDHALQGTTDISPRFSLVEDPPTVGSIAILIPSGLREPTADPYTPKRGLVILIFRLDATIRATLPANVLKDLDLLLIDESATLVRERVLFESRTGLAQSLLDDADAWGRRFHYLSRKWSIRVAPRHSLGYSALSLSLLALGVALSLGAGLATYLVGTMSALREEVWIAKELGQYRLKRKLGEGGMGVVYEAEHALLRRPTAIKMVSERALGAEGLERFEREVRSTSQLTHPNTVSIYDFGRSTDGVFYYAMEHIAGVTIEELVRDAGALPAARVAHLWMQMCGSLHEAHSAGLVHRDIKPSNLMVCERGLIADFVKVLDFGLVKQVAVESELKITDAERMLGTPQYMAPEALLRQDAITPAIDIYALGCVAYFMLTGIEAFRGDTVASIVAQQLHDLPKPPSQVCASPIPAALDDLVLRCLAKEAAARPSSMASIIQSLQACTFDTPWTPLDARTFWNGYRARRSAAPSTVTTIGGTGNTLAVDLERRSKPSNDS